MTRFARSTLTLVVLSLAIAPARGQLKPVRSTRAGVKVPPAPTIDFVSPPGATIGATNQITLTGLNLKDIRIWIDSADGVEVSDLNDKDKTASFKLKIAAGAEPGFRELRAIGAGGMSNLALLRFDTLKQSDEVEKNDSRERAREIAPGTAVCGALAQLDLDFYRFDAKRGLNYVIEVEANRLGTVVSPVVDVLDAKGISLVEARESRGVDHDCRFVFTPPHDGSYWISLRDNVYRGDDHASYRLRLHDGKFASAMFPLGGTAGGKVEVAASGRNLERPVFKTVSIPDTPGGIFEIGAFETERGAIVAPCRMIAGDLPESVETDADASFDHKPVLLKINTIYNGRIGRPGEVDRFDLELKKGVPVRLAIDAARLGSWLDSVLTLRNAAGEVAIENDDSGPPSARRNVGVPSFDFGPRTDSMIEFTPPADGRYTLELADRYGEGGAEYAYRLTYTVNQPDIQLFYRAEKPAATANPRRGAGRAPASAGGVNVAPGGVASIPYQIVSHGFTGSVEVRAVGLPEGVKGDPATIQVRPAPPNRRGNNQANAGDIRQFMIKADPAAFPATSRFSLVASVKLGDGRTITRFGAAAIAVDSTIPQVGNQLVPRTIERIVMSCPITIIGDINAIRSAPGMNSRPATIATIDLPGSILQGCEGLIAIGFDPSSPSETRSFHIEATPGIEGMTVEPTIVETPDSKAREGRIVRGVVKVGIGAKVPAGVYSVKLSLVRDDSGESIDRDVSVIVEPPASLEIVDPGDSIVIGEGGVKTLGVAINRRKGFDGTIELKFEGEPAGLRIEGNRIIESGLNRVEIGLVRPKGIGKAGTAAELRVIGIARTVRGGVMIEAKKRPRIVFGSTDE